MFITGLAVGVILGVLLTVAAFAVLAVGGQGMQGGDGD